jgi:cell division septum initiation protein DivIVA
MVQEESDDLIATLEQENRQLHERNKRLMAELEGFADNAEKDALADLRRKLDMGDNDKFEVFRTSVKALAKCFEKGNKGVLIADIGDKVSIMGINAEIDEVAMMAAGTAEKLTDVLNDMQDEDRVLN